MIRRSILSSSTSLGSTPGTPSRSSAVKPLELHKAPEALLLDSRALEVAVLSLHPEALSPLETVLRAEASTHLRRAAFEKDPITAATHRGITIWIEEFLDGVLLARMKEQAHQKLGLEEPAGLPVGGSDYMQSDGLGETHG